MLLKACSCGCERDFLVTTGCSKARSNEPSLAVFPLLCKLVCSLVLPPEFYRFLCLDAASPGRFGATSLFITFFLGRLPGTASPTLCQVRCDGVHGLALSWQHPAGQDGGGLSIPCWSLSLIPCARRSSDAAAQRGRICGRWEQMAFAPLKAKLSLLSGSKAMFSSPQGSNLSLVCCSWPPQGIKGKGFSPIADQCWMPWILLEAGGVEVDGVGVCPGCFSGAEQEF